MLALSISTTTISDEHRLRVQHQEAVIDQMIDARRPAAERAQQDHRNAEAADRAPFEQEASASRPPKSCTRIEAHARRFSVLAGKRERPDRAALLVEPAVFELLGNHGPIINAARQIRHHDLAGRQVGPVDERIAQIRRRSQHEAKTRLDARAAREPAERIVAAAGTRRRRGGSAQAGAARTHRSAASLQARRGRSPRSARSRCRRAGRRNRHAARSPRMIADQVEQIRITRNLHAIAGRLAVRRRDRTRRFCRPAPCPDRSGPVRAAIRPARRSRRSRP